jgi:hypothetical protein
MYDELVNLFGDLLSKVLDKPPIACKGLFRYAIKDYERKNEREPGKFLNYEDFKKIIYESIRNRLEWINFKNIDKIIPQMMDELIKHQAIFTLIL